MRTRVDEDCERADLAKDVRGEVEEWTAKFEVASERAMRKSGRRVEDLSNERTGEANGAAIFFDEKKIGEHWKVVWERRSEP
jgi:hypothetical protein